MSTLAFNICTYLEFKRPFVRAFLSRYHMYVNTFWLTSKLVFISNKSAHNWQLWCPVSLLWLLFMFDCCLRHTITDFSLLSLLDLVGLLIPVQWAAWWTWASPARTWWTRAEPVWQPYRIVGGGPHRSIVTADRDTFLRAWRGTLTHRYCRRQRHTAFDHRGAIWDNGHQEIVGRR